MSPRQIKSHRTASVKAEHTSQVAEARSQHEAEIKALNQQIEALKNPPQPTQRWDQLAGILLNSPVFAKVRAAADTSIAASNAYTDLGLNLTVIRQIDRFTSAIERMRGAMAQVELGFTIAELEQINQALATSGFELQLV